MRRRVPELAALPVGALVGLVSLETAGLAMLLLIPAGVVLKQRRAARIPLLMVTFAVGYLLAIGFFALRTSGILNGDGVDWGVAALLREPGGRRRRVVDRWHGHQRPCSTSRRAGRELIEPNHQRVVVLPVSYLGTPAVKRLG